jgi:hypothetical protein
MNRAPRPVEAWTVMRASYAQSLGEVPDDADPYAWIEIVDEAPRPKLPLTVNL